MRPGSFGYLVFCVAARFPAHESRNGTAFFGIYISGTFSAALLRLLS